MAKKKTTKKKTTKKKVAKKATKKVAKKKVAKKVAKKATKKKVAKKKATTKKSSTRKAIPVSSKKVAKKTAVKRRRRRGVSVSDAAREEEADVDGFVYVNGRKIRMIVSNGLAKKKRRTKAKTTGDTENKILSLKTKLTTKQLREFRDRLLKYRARLLIDLGAIEKEALDVNSDVKLGMAASERKRIRDIEDALVRIRKKTYGVCHLTGSKIPDARLHAKPWAKYTKDAAEKIERRTRRR